MITIKSKKEIELIRESCRITAGAHKEMEKAIKPGVSTLELDKIAEKYIKSCGAIPSFKGYNSKLKNVPDYPATACISINEEVIHGIPSSKTYLREGDIVSIDLGAYKNGFHGDAARTYIVGNVGDRCPRSFEQCRM